MSTSSEDFQECHGSNSSLEKLENGATTAHPSSSSVTYPSDTVLTGSRTLHISSSESEISALAESNGNLPYDENNDAEMALRGVDHLLFDGFNSAMEFFESRK